MTALTSARLHVAAVYTPVAACGVAPNGAVTRRPRTPKPVKRRANTAPLATLPIEDSRRWDWPDENAVSKMNTEPPPDDLTACLEARLPETPNLEGRTSLMQFPESRCYVMLDRFLSSKLEELHFPTFAPALRAFEGANPFESSGD